MIPVTVPPLRERRDDIPLLVRHFARRTSEEHNIKPAKFDARTMEALQRYRWRGNIRELRNTIERLLIMTPGDTIHVDDLPAEVRGDGAAQVSGAAGAGVSIPQGGVPPSADGGSVVSTGQPGTLREFKEAAERAFLVDKLRENGWNISKTAEALDTPRSNLYKKLEQYGIKQEIDG